MRRPVTMDRVTMVLVGRGSGVTGRQGGLPMVGGEAGFLAIGDRALVS
jgi:hypothetical protein